MKLKEIKNIYAEDITNYGSKEIEKLRKKKKGFEIIATSCGVYGINGALLQGNKSKKLYKIVCRNSTLFQLV